MKINLHDKMPLQDNEQKILLWENNSSVEFPLANSHTCYYITINCYRVFNFSVNDGLTYYHQQVFAQSYIYNDQYCCCSLLDIILSNYSTFLYLNRGNTILAILGISDIFYIHSLFFLQISFWSRHFVLFLKLILRLRYARSFFSIHTALMTVRIRTSEPNVGMKFD